MDNREETELKRLEQKLTDELSRCPVPDELPPDFVNKVTQKIRIRQRQIFVRRIFALSGAAAILLIGLGITWFLLKGTKQEPQIGLTPPQVQADEFEIKLSRVEVPSDAAGRIQLLSQLIGTEDFTLSFDRKNDTFAFVSPQKPKNLKNNHSHWRTKLHRAVDKCFPKTQNFDCLVAEGKAKKWSLLQ